MNPFVTSLARTAGLIALVGLHTLSVASPTWQMKVCADPNRMPYSNASMQGYDNRIAAILADELGAELEFVWTSMEQLSIVLSDFLYEGQCDLIFGLQDGEEGVLPSAAYYRSPYTFVFRSDAPYVIDSFDAPELRTLRVGVLGAPGEAALRQRGIVENIVPWAPFTGYDHEDWLGDIIRAVADGTLDAAVTWGPVAGYYRQAYGDSLSVVPVPLEIEPPFIYLVRPITIGFRPHDTAFRDSVDRALARRWDEIQAVLTEFGVPLSSLPRPLEHAGEGRP